MLSLSFQLPSPDQLIFQILFYVPFFLFILYGQRIQTWMILNDVSRSLNKLKVMKEKSRKEAVDYVNVSLKPPGDPTERIDQFLEYFTILPVDLDPHGVVKKIEHVVTVRDDRVRAEIKNLAPGANSLQTSAAENILEVATALNLIYKIIRHFYLMGKRTNSLYILVQVQMVMPILLQEADALVSAIDAFKQYQPIGDGIGAMVVGKLMLGKEKRTIAKDTVIADSEYKGRSLILMKAEGPGGYVGQPGNAVQKLIEEMNSPINSIIMIDAALKLEGEKTGELAEGIGAAIGGLGDQRFEIEEVATRRGLPLYAIVIKQSILDAISVMKKEIAEASDKVLNTVYRILEEKTKEGERILVIGVGNTLGISQ